MRDPAAHPPKIGKFDILRVLGKGAQSVVYLAHDAHLQREVAIKSLHLDKRDEARKQALIDEARTVSRLRHPNIVPIFDAGEQDGDPYLVFEYVEGRSLADRLRDSGGLPAPRAVETMLQILDAVEHAHRHGIIHRDLKPSNILMNADGVPRVMDFGIAVRVNQDGSPGIGEGILGTPAYLAPECINEGRASVQSDVFSAGLILCELVTGKPVVGGKSVLTVLHRMSSEPIRLPPEAAGVVDDRLGDIILKATAMDTAARYADVAALRDALKAWLTPREEEAPARAGEGGKQSTLDFLLRRMRHKSDFPALSEAISTINRLAASEQESVSSLSNTILKDVALTNKLMRLVNAAYYKQAGGGTISTISRAVMILGFGTVRSIATSLILMEHLQNQGQATQLREEFVRAIMSGILARDMAKKGMAKDFEEAFICSMFHNLGRMLACFYFPDETVEVRKQQAQQGGSEAMASARVLGISYEELGIGVARSWGFPDSMVGSMRRLPDGAVKKSPNPNERLRQLAGLSDELCAVFEQVPADKQKSELEKISRRFGDCIPLDQEQLEQTVKRSLEEVVSYTAAIRLNLQQSALGRQISAWSGKGAGGRGSVRHQHPGQPDADGNRRPRGSRAFGNRGGHDVRPQPRGNPIHPQRRHPGHHRLAGGRLRPRRHPAHHHRDHVPRHRLPARPAVHQGCPQQQHGGQVRLRGGNRGNRPPLQIPPRRQEGHLRRGAQPRRRHPHLRHPRPEDQRPHPGMVRQGGGGGDLHPLPAGDQERPGRADLRRQAARRRAGHSGKHPLHAAGAAQPGGAGDQASAFPLTPFPRKGVSLLTPLGKKSPPPIPRPKGGGDQSPPPLGGGGREGVPTLIPR